MNCKCERYLTQQTRIVAKLYGLDGTQCLSCMAVVLQVPYQDLLDKYQGIDECRECSRQKKLAERKRLLGL